MTRARIIKAPNTNYQCWIKEMLASVIIVHMFFQTIVYPYGIRWQVSVWHPPTLPVNEEDIHLDNVCFLRRKTRWQTWWIELLSGEFLTVWMHTPSIMSNIFSLQQSLYNNVRTMERNRDVWLPEFVYFCYKWQCPWGRSSTAATSAPTERGPRYINKLKLHKLFVKWFR